MHDHPLPCMPGRSFVYTVDRMRVRARVLDHTYHHRNYAHAHFLKHVMRVRTYVYVYTYTRTRTRLREMASSNRSIRELFSATAPPPSRDQGRSRYCEV